MKNKKLIVIALGVLVLIGALLGVYAATRPDTAEGAKSYMVTVIHKDSTTVKDFFYHTDEEYLADALLAEGLIAGEDGPYGLTLITVDGEEAVWDRDNAYWCIYIGEEMATVGISEIPVYDGSAFTLEYTSLG